MTVSRIRELMQERVIPESVLPQNIAAYLSDGDYLPPELDAFTFLNRLRSLGIGSADFLYLLKGCGAPEEAIEKIEQHPDMNLQSLIMTLDGSGLTSQDYTRMLYTARQLWEHTITMRLDMEEAREEVPEEQPPQSEPAYTARQKKASPESETTPEQEKTEKPEKIRTARQKKKQEPEFREYIGVKPIGKRDLPEECEELTDDSPVKTAVQLKPLTQEDAEDNEAELPDKSPAEDNPANRRAGIITAAAGAAVLFALSAGMELMGFSAPENSSAQAHFAKDNAEIFAEISKAYHNDKIGGQNHQPLFGREQVFGDLLIDPGEQLGTFSSDNTLWAAEPSQITVYSISGDETAITAEILPPKGAQFLTVYRTENGIAAVFNGDESCGITGVDSSGQSYITEQSGTLTDYFFDGEVIRLGSVYTPEYTRSFTSADTAEYLPAIEKDGSAVIFEPSDIVVTGSALGCSFAVWGEYSADNGECSDKVAALGDPLYCAAERFTAVLQQEKSSLLICTGENNEPMCQEIGVTTAAAYGGEITATEERSETGTVIYLRDAKFQPISGFSTDSDITALRIESGVICVRDDEKTVMAVDISDPASPAPLELTAAQGIINGGYALCNSKTASGITLTLYQLTEGKAVQTDAYAKSLTGKELESLQFCGANTAVINGSELCGAAYRWFDGVSVVDEFAQLGKSRSVKTLYDDRDGFTAAASVSGKLILICGEKTYN